MNTISPLQKKEREAFIKRLRTCVLKAGGVRALSKSSGTAECQFYRYFRIENDITLGRVWQIAEATGVSYEWLLTGRGKEKE